MRGRQPMCRHSPLADHLAQPSTQRQGRPGERLRLLAMQRAQVEEGLTGGLLDLTARALEFLGSARMHGDEAGETQERVTVAQVLLVICKRLLFTLTSRRLHVADLAPHLL